MNEKYQLVLERKAERVKSLNALLSDLLSKESDKKITFELGCGKGHYLSSYGVAFPNELCLGIDIISSRVKDGMKKAEKKGALNVHFFKAEAKEFLDALPMEKKFSKVIIMFPDPWPKKRHHKNRIMQEDFLTNLHAKCEKGAKLFFRTDHSEYFDRSLNEVKNHPKWKILDGENFPFEEETQFQRYMDSWQTLVAEAL